MRIAVLLAAVAISIAPGRARADVHGFVEPSVSFATSETSQLHLYMAGVGAGVPIGESLALRGSLRGLATSGRVDGGAAARGGVGGQLALRLAPWSAARVAPFLQWGGGLFVSREPLLPGGTRYELSVDFGAGLAVRIGDAWRAGIELRTTHLSNGQGLGDHNPAFDGLGLAASIERTLMETPARSSSGEAPAEAAAPVQIWVDAGVGEADETLLVAGRGVLAWRVHEHALLQVDAEGGEIADRGYGEVGLDAAFPGRVVRAGAHLGARRYVGTRTLIAAAQVEVALSREVSAVGMVHGETHPAFGDFARAATGLRALPHDDLRLDLGVGFDRLGQDTPGDDHSDPYLGVEWRVPARAGSLSASLFLERRVSSVNVIGVRGVWGDAPSVRERLAGSWLRLR